MFEHRLGLALNKSIGEIRSLPYPEYRSWELFSILEPFGWENDEYRAASLLALIYNVNKGKGKAKTPKDFMRDTQAEILKQLEQAPDISDLPIEEQREILMRQIKKDFGIK